MTTLHKIKAYLYDNVFTKDKPNDYIARTVSEQSLTVKQICEIAVSRGGAEVTTSAMEHATELFLKEMAYQLCDGYAINTGYFTAGTQIRGSFNSPQEKFDAEKHSILFQFTQGDKLRTLIPAIEVDIAGLAEAFNVIHQITDVNSGSINDILTPNRNLKIHGSKIKIVGENPDNGIYFVNTITGEGTKADSNDIAVNKPSELIIIIPNLGKGTYRLEIATQYTGGKIHLKEPRIILLDRVLTVL